MFSLLIDLAALASSDSRIPVALRWKRIRHLRDGHDFDNSILLDKLRSEKHPRNDGEVVYTVNVLECRSCGLTFLDEGFEFRRENLPSARDPRVPVVGIA